MTFKQLIGKIHLVLGLASGLVIFLVALTGAVLVFEQEVKSLFPEAETASGKRSIEIRNQRSLKPSEILAILEAQYPGIPASGVNYHKGYSSLCWAWKDGPNGYDYSIRVNPYTGEIVEKESHDEEIQRSVDVFFEFFLDGHLYLWLPHETGKAIVDYATLIFLIMLITGIVLWWPKNKAARKQRFRFRWKLTTKWRRKNYDLHNVLGFYMSWVGVFLTITGLVMAFEWFSNGYYYMLSAGKSREIIRPEQGIPEIQGDPVDILWERFNTRYPDFDGWLEIYFTESNDDAIMFLTDPFPGRKKSEYHSYNPYTLEEVGADSPVAYTMFAENYSIHVGEIGGLPTKLLAFFASLIAASLPVTGFLIWRGRANKGDRVKSRGDDEPVTV